MKFNIIHRDDEYSIYVSKQLKKKCQDIGWIYDENDFDTLLSIGGDGTLLRGIHQYIDLLDHIQFVGIHTGTLGFFTDYTAEEIESFIQDIKKNMYSLEESPLLMIELPEKNQKFYAFNEVRIESLAKTLSLDVYIDGEFFERTTGSGICISTQSGSTAVNRALQGAVIDSGLQVLQLCEIMPISHKSHHSLRSPYIMKQDRSLLIEGQSLSYAHACYDHLETSLEDVSTIKICTSNKKVRFARYREYSYLKRLKNLY